MTLAELNYLIDDLNVKLHEIDLCLAVFISKRDTQQLNLRKQNLIKQLNNLTKLKNSMLN